MDCNSCIFRGKDKLGDICRRYPPQLLAVSDDKGRIVGRAMFPKLWLNDQESFCGEYKQGEVSDGYYPNRNVSRPYNKSSSPKQDDIPF